MYATEVGVTGKYGTRYAFSHTFYNGHGTDETNRLAMIVMVPP
jgi:hypothetical protein